MKILSTAVLTAALLAISQPVFSQTLLDQARLNLDSGQYEKALALAALLPADAALDAALIRTRVFLARGDIAQAKVAARFAVDLAPKSFDARFLYALVLENSAEDNKATLHFRRAIDLASNDLERKLAADSIHRIGAKKTVKLNGSIGLAPSTNLNKATANDQVDLVFGTADITSADPLEDVGLTYALNAEFANLPALSVGVAGMATNSGTYDQSTLSFNYEKSTDQRPVSLSYQASWLAGSFYKSMVSATTKYSLKKARQLTFGVDAISYATRENELVTSVALSDDLYKSDALKLTAELRAARHGSETAKYASTSGGASLSALFEGAEFDVQMAASVNLRSWDQAVTLFPDAREDRDAIFSIVLSPRNTSFLGLKPIFRASFLDRQSNIALYDIQSHDFYVGYDLQY